MFIIIIMTGYLRAGSVFMAARLVETATYKTLVHF
jgi:methenyltetrahydromethanopterin cyclohydrolase